MSYIIKHDFNQEIPYYVKVVNTTTFDETYDPQNATQFKTKKEAQTWIDVYSSMKEYSKVVDFKESAKEFQVWLDDGMVRRTLNCINRTVSRPYNNESIDEVIEWWIYQKYNDDVIDFEDYQNLATPL